MIHGSSNREKLRLESSRRNQRQHVALFNINQHTGMIHEIEVNATMMGDFGITLHMGLSENVGLIFPMK